MSIYTIYRATNLINGKVYIGFDSSWPNRQKDHKRDYHTSDLIFHRAIKKHGWDNFVWKILYQSKDGYHTLNTMESFFILENNSYVFVHNSNGYNMAKGGGGTLGMKHSNSTKQKISNSKTGARYVPKQEKCKFCLNLFAERQIPIHERSCDYNPNKTNGHSSGKTIRGTIKNCRYCNASMKTTVLSKHEKTCDLNLDKTKIVYKSYKQQISTCEHCGKSGGIGLMKRYHHENCKLVDFSSLL